MNRPTLEEARKVGVDQQKFYCGRKHKFGLNCQAVCDVRGRFLDISITYGASSSDLLAFELRPGVGQKSTLEFSPEVTHRIVPRY